jgi:hypothetical protein
MTFFYDLNKKLDEIRATPSKTHGQLNERDMSRAAKGYEKYGKEGMEALAKAGREGKDLDPIRAKYDKYDNTEVDEGLGNIVKKVGGAAKKLGSKALDTLGHGNDADMMRDLQKRMGVPQTGMKPGSEPNPKVVKEKMSPAKAKSFAALAEPKDKITFADKIAGAKKEVDEMLGDVAAEAMKSALGGGRGRNAEMDEGWDDMVADVKRRAGDHGGMRVGDRVKTSKGEVEKTATGIRHTRAYDAKTGETDTGDNSPASGEKRGRGRPAGKGAGKSIGAKGPSGRSKLMTREGGGDQAQQIYNDLADIRATAKQAQGGGEFPQGFASRLESVLWAAMTMIKNQQPNDAQVREEELDEKAVSKKQQKFMGMVHAAQKGEKAPSKEVAKVAKSMGKKDAEDFASTKHKGLPEKAKAKKEESLDKHSDSELKAAAGKDVKADKKSGVPANVKTSQVKDEIKKRSTKEVDESSTTAGSVAPAATGSKGGMTFGKGIYDSMNRELENMIAESMSINMSMNNDEHGGPSKSLTVTATDDDAMKLSQLLKSAGLGGGNDQGYGGTGYQSACGCSEPGCGCDQQAMDEAYGDTVPTENAPNYPTNTETAQDNFEYSGGLNGPKSTGQTTVPVIASQEERQHSYAAEEEDAIRRMMEMAGIKKKEVDEEKTEEGNLFTGNLAKARAAGKKEADLDGDGNMEKVRESVAGLWSEYKGKYGV